MRLRREQEKQLAFGISTWCLHTALLIGCMMSYDLKLGVLWLLWPRRKGREVTGNPQQADILTYLEEQFLEVDADWLMSYVEPETSPIQRSCIATAVAFVSEFRVAELIWKRNVQHGAVVRAPELVDEYNKLLTEQPGANAGVALKGHHMENSTRCWAYRLRGKTGCQVGCVNFTDKGLKLEDMRAKAAVHTGLGPREHAEYGLDPPQAWVRTGAGFWNGLGPIFGNGLRQIFFPRGAESWNRNPRKSGNRNWFQKASPGAPHPILFNIKMGTGSPKMGTIFGPHFFRPAGKISAPARKKTIGVQISARIFGKKVSVVTAPASGRSASAVGEIPTTRGCQKEP